MSETQTQQQPPAQEGAKEQPKRSTGYRVEEQKTIEINRAHTDRRERAQILKTITIGLFGRRRYRNIYLVSSLNNFYYALLIANTLQKRVQKLALVIGLEKVKYTEFAEEGAQGEEKEYSTFSIKITREPTEEDKKHPGYNQGLENIENPLTEIMKLGGQRRRNDRRNPVRRNYQPRREGQRRREGEGRRREGDDRRRVEGSEGRRPQRSEGRTNERDEKDFERRRPRREGQEQGRRYDEKRGEGQRDRRGEGRGYNRDEDYDRRQPQKRYRQDKFEKVEDDEYKRGERKTRGNQQRPQGQGRVAEHEYKKEHMNRRNDEREDRRDRAPRKNRYSSDDEY